MANIEAKVEKTIRQRLNEWRTEIVQHKYLILVSIFLVMVATLLDLMAGRYADRVGVATSPDLILDNINSVDLSPIFTWGFMIVIWLMFLYPILFKVKKFHVVASQFSLLIALRSLFVCFTHLKMPADAVTIHFPGIITNMSFTNDLFFSGHVAVPFLGFLLFEDSKLKWFFLIATIIMAITVLLMHVHYSIDVFSAVFITYGSFKIGDWFFKKFDRH